MKNAFKNIVIPMMVFLTFYGCATKDDFEITSWNSHTHKPILFYISGDGGFNTFSKGLGKNLHALGYDVFALNTKLYFWNKKTPEQTSAAIENYISMQLQGRKNQKVILAGYSFGADVTSFVYNHFTEGMKKKIQHVFIIGPSKTTDFKIHLTEYFGAEPPKGSFPVIPEINKMNGVPLTLILSDFEFAHFPYQEITLTRQYQMKHIAGTHDYDDNTQMLSAYIHEILEDKKPHKKH